MKVLVAMSGGVDSSVAALLLKRAGYSIEGVFMENWDYRIEEGNNCTLGRDWTDAQKVAHRLEIPIRRVNFTREYWQDVFQPLIDGYRDGSTPNPDLMCNRFVKFGKLFEWSKREGFCKLATGHYSRIFKTDQQYFISQAKHLFKDQSYFLANIHRDTLADCLFPIGNVESKSKVKELAKEFGLQFLLEKEESMGVCFVGKRKKFNDFIEQFIAPENFKIIEIETGKEIGNYHGFPTIGQCLKIGGLSGKLFVAAKDTLSKSIFATLNRDHELINPKFITVSTSEGDLSKCDIKNLTCSIRSADKYGSPISEIVKINNVKYKIIFEDNIFAPAAGQAAVFYRYLPDEGYRIVVNCGTIS